MISKDEAENIINDNIDEKRLRKIIRNTSRSSVQARETGNKIEKWLGNFQGKYFNVDSEKKLALWLLNHFCYYTYKDIRVLCRELFDKFIHTKLMEMKCDSRDLQNDVKGILDNTIFIGIGNNSESGANILYYFRQENKLSKKNFEVRNGKKYENVVYIDDVSLSGTQAIDNIRMSKISANNRYAGFLISAEKACERIKKTNDLKMKIVSAMVLDERDQAFSANSFVFSQRKMCNLLEHAKCFCELYGRKAGEGYEVGPLGYLDGQYMIGFEYNTPDNTLPIFWGDGNGWQPLFKRHCKNIYNEGDYYDGRKYY